MDPHDQHEAVPSPEGITESAGCVVSGITVPNRAATRLDCLRGVQLALPFIGDARLCRLIPTTHHENELPQPQDFDALGLVNTNPCCISVSW